MSYPVRQADARKKEESKNGNISSVQILRGGHESGGLGSRWVVLCPLRGEYGGKLQPGAGRFSVFAAAVGTGAGLATSHESCVVRLDYLPPWRGQVVPESRLDLPGWCPSFPSWRRLRLPSGGRWHDRRKIQSSEVNDGPNGLGWRRRAQNVQGYVLSRRK
jgi:hypothetical protein